MTISMSRFLTSQA